MRTWSLALGTIYLKVDINNMPNLGLVVLRLRLQIVESREQSLVVFIRLAPKIIFGRYLKRVYRCAAGLLRPAK